MEQKIKQDQGGNIGKNIREIRLERGIGQTELVRMLDLKGISITRECLVKIERGIQHVQVQQLKGIKIELRTSFDELLSKRLQKEADPAAAVAEAMELIFAVKPGGLVPFEMTQEFIEAFGRDAADRLLELTHEPLSYAVSNIDMIFENIMVSGDKYYCLDYEWVLDFPVPAQFIRYRNLHYFYRKFGGFLSAHCPRREFLERLYGGL